MRCYLLRTASRILSVATIFLATALAACVQTSQVDSALTTASLTRDKQAAVVLRIGAASPTCQHVAILLGTPDGAGFRRHKVLQVGNVHSLVEPAVAETELEPGAYHIIGYACHDGKKPQAVAQKADPGFLFTPGTYRTSYAHFAVQAGEIVNLGYLHFHASRIGTNAFGRPVRTTVTVTDWPLAELARFKQRRPQIYAQMVTRLMTVSPTGPGEPTSSDCARLRALKAEGKVQAVPISCQDAVARR